MRIKVADLRRSRVSEKTVSWQGTLEPLEYGGVAVRFEGPVEGEVDLHKKGDGIVARVRVRLHGQARCDRCLGPVDIDLDCDYEEEFVPPHQGGAEAEDGAGEHQVSEIAGDEVDLTEGLRQSIILSLPSKVVCREDCRGLCATCGCDLNKGECNCNVEASDPRFDALRPLLERMNAEQGESRRK